MVITYQLHDPNKNHSSCFENYSLGLTEQLQVSKSNQMVKSGRSIGRFLLEKAHLMPNRYANMVTKQISTQCTNQTATKQNPIIQEK